MSGRLNTATVAFGAGIVVQGLVVSMVDNVVKIFWVKQCK